MRPGLTFIFWVMTKALNLESWLETNFGEPIEKRTGRGFWKTELMFVAAMLPETPASCLLRLLPLQETAEIDRVKLL
jgi:hypothetical protein